MKAETQPSSQIVDMLEPVFHQHQLSAAQAGGWTSDQRQKHNEIILAWFCATLHYTRRGTKANSLITDGLDSSSTSAISSNPVSQDTAKSPTARSTDRSTEDSTTAALFDFTRFLACAPIGRLSLKKWPEIEEGTINLNNLVDQDADYWEVHDTSYKANAAPVPEAVMHLRSILIVLGLILTSRQQGATTTCYTLAKLLQSLVNNVTYQFAHISPAILAEKGYSTISDDDGTVSDDDSTLDSCHLVVVAIVGLVLGLIRLNLRQDASHIIGYCHVLRCMLAPHWGFVAATARSEVLKSGSAPSHACLLM